MKENISEGSVVGRFELTQKIVEINDLIEYLQKEKSIFWNFKIMPTAFFMNWQLRLIINSMNSGRFYKIKKITLNK